MRHSQSKAEERFKDFFVLGFILLVEWIYLMFN